MSLVLSPWMRCVSFATLLAFGLSGGACVSPSSVQLCPAHVIPADWLPRCLAGQLLFTTDSTCTMPSIGNGYLATVVQSDSIYAAGLFNGPVHDNVHRARIPPYVTQIEDAVASDEVVVQAFDMERAVFLRRRTLSSGVEVEDRWYAPLHEPSLLVHEMEIASSGYSGTVNFNSSAGAASVDLTLTPTKSSVDGLYVVGGSNLVPEVGENHTSLAVVANILPSDIVVLAGAEALTVYALTAVVTSLNSTNPTSDALDLVKRYSTNDFELASTLFSNHVEAWRSRLDAGRVEVDGDLFLAQAVNASLHAIRASIREDFPWGISPGGLSTDGYRGHSFWDAETWMYPPLLMLEPGSARSLIEYRKHRMAGARLKAVAMGPNTQAGWAPPGYENRLAPEAVAFPWESAFSGQEAQYQKGTCGPWCQYEQHISGDVSLALRQFWYTTRDLEWLEAVAFPIANGTASFFAARVEERSPGVFSFNNVMGPDEYAYPVNNSAYTNAVTSIALNFAAEAATELGYTGDIYSSFVQKAEGLVLPFAGQVPTMPQLQGYHPEYEGFPRNSTNPKVKQADTVMLAYPLGVQMEQEVLANDLTFYDAVTDVDGPAMTHAMFAIGWFNLSHFDKSAGSFARSYANMQWPFGVWAETPSGGCGNFITGAGGFLQTVVFGTSGMRIERDRLFFSPPPPSATGTGAVRLTMHSFHYLGSRLRQEVTADVSRYELLETSPGAPRLFVEDLASSDRQQLEVGVAVELARGPVSISAGRPQVMV